VRLIEVGSTGGVLHGLTVVPREGGRTLVRAVLEKSLGLLLASRPLRLRVTLRGSGLWGRRGLWLAPLRELHRAALEQGRELSLSFDTPEPVPAGLLRSLRELEAEVVVRAGPREGPGLARSAAQLRRLRAAGVLGVFEAVLGPRDLPALRPRLKALEALAPAKVRLRLELGVLWPPGSEGKLRAGLSEWLGGLNQKHGDRPQPLDVLNLYEDPVPELLANELRLGPDGALVWRPAHGDGPWPGLRAAFPAVAARGLDGLDALFRSPGERLARANAALTGAARGLWLNNVHLALSLCAFFKKPIRGFHDRSENPAIKRGLLLADFRGQDRFLRLRLPDLDRMFYFLRSGCLLDCIFCKAKVADPGQSFDEVEAAMRQNLKVGRTRVALLGNEPLLHPRILDILRLCRRCGFREVEVMTSGTLLADAGFARRLVEAGATSFPIPVYSSDPDEHDALTRRPGSFRDVVAGIVNLRRVGGAEVYLHTNLMKQNLRSVAKLERWALQEMKLPFSILPLRPKDPDSMNLPYADLAPSYEQILREVRSRSLAAFPVCIQRRVPRPGDRGPRGGAVNLPRRGQRSPVIAGARIADSIKLYILHQSFVKPETCLGCPHYPHCVGTFREQLAAYPADQELLRP